ncbi:MAG: hypothetical protein ACJAYJ_004611 [Saprospiraceae bacterium]|jgi:hypothetical protein
MWGGMLFLRHKKTDYCAFSIFWFASDVEVIRVVKLLDKWIPGTMNGQVAEVEYNLPISIKLE